MNKSKEVSEFYDNFEKKLVEDFFRPNQRIENAILLALKGIPLSAKVVLDLGFGLGWSSYEIARHFPNSSVYGLDISEKLTATAASIFQRENLRFESMDLTRDFPEGIFDVIILIDVYEHIPVSARSKFYENIRRSLSENGRVIFTCPTIYHQNYLRKHKPGGLQPVDEDIDIHTFLDFCKNTDSEISHFAYLDIWNSRDYLHCIIEKPWKYHTNQKGQYLEKFKLLDFYAKYSLVQKSNVDITLLPELTIKQKAKSIFKRFLY
jgi:cyclopropane fatty-acyl-phospholipid synthase-like methyltransferase